MLVNVPEQQNVTRMAECYHYPTFVFFQLIFININFNKYLYQIHIRSFLFQQPCITLAAW